VEEVVKEENEIAIKESSVEVEEKVEE